MRTHILLLISLIAFASCGNDLAAEIEASQNPMHAIINKLDVPVELITSEGRVQYNLTLLPEEEYIFSVDKKTGNATYGSLDFWNIQSITVLISGYPEIVLYCSGHPSLNDEKYCYRTYWEDTSDRDYLEEAGSYDMTWFINEEFISNFSD